MPRPEKHLDMILVRGMVARGLSINKIVSALRSAGISCASETLRRRIKREGLTTRFIKSRGEPMASNHGGRGEASVKWEEPGTLSPKWGPIGNSLFTDAHPTRLEAETHWRGWWSPGSRDGLPPIEVVTHRGYSHTYSATALDL